MKEKLDLQITNEEECAAKVYEEEKTINRPNYFERSEIKQAFIDGIKYARTKR